MEYVIKTSKGQSASITKELFIDLSVIATFAENQDSVNSLTLAIHLKNSHLDIWPIISQRIFDLTVSGIKTGLRNFNKLSSTEYFD